MISNPKTINWPVLSRPYGRAERALGRLAHGLETSPLHATWIWREITRVSVAIAQAGGYHAKVDQLRLALIGAPLASEDNTPGLAAAKRVFLASAPLFRPIGHADSKSAPWPRFWQDEPRSAQSGASDGWSMRAGEAGPAEKEAHERDQLVALVRELAGFADDGQRPALINLLVDLRKHSATRHLPPALVRIALPLALAKAGLVPKGAPGLLGGRRLPLGLSRAASSEKPLSNWLAKALEDLRGEADQSYRRLVELTSQHQAWHAALAKEGLRKHARTPKVLDLLMATPVLSIGLVACHLGCSHVAAGHAVARLVDLGILIEQTSRARHKVFIAGDLPVDARRETGPTAALATSEPIRPVDVDALTATLDGVFADLDRQTELAKARLNEARE